MKATHGKPLLALLGSVAAASAVGADDVDTSAWVCEYCPFEEQSGGAVDVGLTAVSDDTAYLGNATGYDEEGVYANLQARGAAATDRQRVRWNVEDLGLDSRLINVEGGQPGRYAYHLDWSEVPYRRFITTSTVFSSGADGALNLPADWVKAPTTAGFTGLDEALRPRSIASDRQTLDLGGRYDFTSSLSLSADYR